MAKSTVILTDVYQEIATSPCIITVKESIGNRKIILNESNSSDNELNFLVSNNQQFQQFSAVSTWAKGAGVTIIVNQED